MRFSLSQLFLCVAFLGCALGWIVDRQHLITQQKVAANAYDRKLSVLINWMHAEPAARTELAWRQLSNLPPTQQLQQITKRTRGSVFWTIQLACEIEPDLDDVFGRHGFTIELAREMLAEYNPKLRTVKEIRQVIEDSYDSDEEGFKETFPALFDPGSSDFRRLDDFLARVCAGNEP